MSWTHLGVLMEDARGRSPDLRPLLMMFVERSELPEDLYVATVKAAYGALKVVGREIPAAAMEDAVGDLAMDFLMNRVMPGRLVDIETVACLKGEVIRYLTSRDAPESRELWSVMSEAIRDLARQGKVARVGEALEERNSNTSVWMLGGVSGAAVFDITGFRERAAEVGIYHPSREGGRIISTGAAKELIVALLEAAAAPLPFGVLIDEACRHVVFGLRHQAVLDHESEDGEVISTAAVEYRCDVNLWLEEEAGVRAGLIWTGSGEVDGEEGHRVLCRYFLPKHFLQQPVTLSAIGGDFRRHSERGKVIRELFARSLVLTPTTEERLGSEDGLFSEALASLTGRVAVLLMEKCSEKYADLNFTYEEPGQERGELS